MAKLPEKPPLVRPLAECPIATAGNVAEHTIEYLFVAGKVFRPTAAEDQVRATEPCESLNERLHSLRVDVVRQHHA